MKRALTAILAILACTGATAQRQTACNFSAWGAARNMVVRAAPMANARIIAVMTHRPATVRGEEINGTFPEFDVEAVQDGWFRINGASYGGYGDPEPARPLYSGRGWVHGSQIGGQLLAGRLHTGPSDRSRSRPYGKDTDAVEVRRLLDCKGNWVKIEADIGTGWVHGLCGNQVTTCN